MPRIPVRSPMPNSPRKPLISVEDLSIYLMILPLVLAALIHLFNSAKVPEAPVNRQIILDVPEKSSVNAQVISQDNTVNLENL